MAVTLARGKETPRAGDINNCETPASGLEKKMRPLLQLMLGPVITFLCLCVRLQVLQSSTQAFNQPSGSIFIPGCSGGSSSAGAGQGGWLLVPPLGCDLLPSHSALEVSFGAWSLLFSRTTENNKSRFNMQSSPLLNISQAQTHSQPRARILTKYFCPS